MEPRPSLAISDNHRRALSATLALLDKSLVAMERWAGGEEIHSVFVQETNRLTEPQRREIRTGAAYAKALIEELRETLNLVPVEEDVGRAIRSHCSTLWVDLLEAHSAHLEGYGPMEPETAAYLDPTLDRMIGAVADILNTVAPGSGGGE